ncbi:hypothetical protein [Bacillus suaedae]|uniref:Lipoprotein n=1 Tax=Halalkalibacter suaedae TaxID=2822140 RepID=A0A940WWI6_9BACI|nr:hypothetical protein [Bacillus suaedae]MBP3951802.1 hypothetical protein [Bacillus suaedae]
MLKLKLITMLLVVSVILFMTACNETSTNNSSGTEEDTETTQEGENDTNVVVEEEEPSNEQETDNEETAEENNTNNNDQNTNNPDVIDEGADSLTDSEQVDEESIKISSGEDAIALLKKELDLEDNDDILFDDTGGILQEDETGSYYQIILISKSMKAAGGSGTVGVYRVYQDGHYEE